MFSIKVKGEDRIVHALIQNIADIPGGVTIDVSELVPGSILKEGTVIGGIDNAGVAHVIKSAAVAVEAAANATTINIEKGSNLKVGDFVSDGKAAVAIAAIDTTSSNIYDTITITPNDADGLSKLVKGAVITQAKSASKTTAAVKYTPVAMAAENYDVKAGENLWIAAVVMGTFKKSLVPPVSEGVLAQLKGIILL